MDAASDIPGSPVAWNGLVLTVPDDWIPAIIDTRHLLITRNDLAVLECKWTVESGPVSIPRKRRALERQMQRFEGFSFTSADIPSHWTELLTAMSPDFEVHPFSHKSANGALCLHRPSNSTVLIQSPLKSAAEAEALRPVLNSMSMALPGAPVPYAINDLQFLAPAGYTLAKAEFKPGLSELDFTDGRCTLSIKRLAPANVVLQGQPFRVWIRDTMDTPLENIRKEKAGLPDGSRKRYRWHKETRPNLLQRLSLFANGKKKTRTIQGTAWIVENENKMLMVTHESGTTTACDSETFESVWRSLRIR
ncbi:hypothetical protein N1030_16955 [Desulfovibrio mangrovi]|uniref:hypothetical protein n=1 Tax=Desulfovibrio mangrovi TaxID=2976983 RepID=UPI002247A147|nr:hypothetical protein [Desulfovibrio mangrovi]UZP67261.1 hypothetical protein N1030_16955 [Desulfovibrio mangrovi]